MIDADDARLVAVLDASALLAFVQDEPGADRVLDVVRGSAVSAANWSEFAQKTLLHADEGRLRLAQTRALGLEVEPLTGTDAERAAALWFSAPHLSLADRCCIATAERLEVDVLTADRAWVDVEAAVPIRLIR